MRKKCAKGAFNVGMGSLPRAKYVYVFRVMFLNMTKMKSMLGSFRTHLRISGWIDGTLPR